MMSFRKLIVQLGKSRYKNKIRHNLEIRRCNHQYSVAGPNYDTNYLLNPKNTDEINSNIKNRKGVGDLKEIFELNDKLKNATLLEQDKRDLEVLLTEAMGKVPNKTHPQVVGYGTEPKVIQYYNQKPEFKDKVLEFSDICKKLNILRTEQLGNFNGHKSYYLIGELAELEQALILYAVSKLRGKGFELISVPDILPAKVIESCGMNTHGERSQVYKLRSDGERLCLSGTSEMALAGYFAGTKNDVKNNPIKLAAVSRCFRAETSSLHEESGIFRVHQFTKVEMFSVCHPDESESVLEEFRDIEVDIFTELGVHFKLLDMPAHELGAPAYRKYDIEAWMPGRNMWGEISSCSDCTDYQSRRLNIRLKNDDEKLEFVHTVNGTACAIPRMLITLIENNQNSDGTITIPAVLQKYMGNREKIVKGKFPDLKLAKKIPREDITSTIWDH